MSVYIMAGLASLAEFVGYAYGKTRKPVSTFVEISFYVIQISKVVAVHVVVEYLCHTELSVKIDSLFQLEFESESHRNREAGSCIAR